MKEKKYLSIREFSEITGSHYQTIWNQVKSGDIPSIQFKDGGKRYIPREVLSDKMKEILPDNLKKDVSKYQKNDKRKDIKGK